MRKKSRPDLPAENQDRLVREHLARYVSLQEAEISTFLSLLEGRRLKAREFLLQEGQVCRQSCFVLSGCLRNFALDQDGTEHILSFAPPGWWIADMYSLISGQACISWIQALEDSEVLLLTKQNQESLYQEVPAFERYFRILAEKSLVAHQQRLIDKMSLSAEDRYLKFCRTYPGLINSLPHKQIASYIGVTPEFFSKMRSRLLRRPS